MEPGGTLQENFLSKYFTEAKLNTRNVALRPDNLACYSETCQGKFSATQPQGPYM